MAWRFCQSNEISMRVWIRSHKRSLLALYSLKVRGVAFSFSAGMLASTFALSAACVVATGVVAEFLGLQATNIVKAAGTMSHKDDTIFILVFL